MVNETHTLSGRLSILLYKDVIFFLSFWKALHPCCLFTDFSLTKIWCFHRTSLFVLIINNTPPGYLEVSEWRGWMEMHAFPKLNASPSIISWAVLSKCGLLDLRGCVNLSWWFVFSQKAPKAGWSVVDFAPFLCLASLKVTALKCLTNQKQKRGCRERRGGVRSYKHRDREMLTSHPVTYTCHHWPDGRISNWQQKEKHLAKPSPVTT